MTDETRSNLDARLQRHGFARDVHRGLSKGIGFLPVSDETKSMLTARSGEAVAFAAETGVALANGAVVAGKGAVDAAREGYHAFEEKREEEEAYESSSAFSAYDASEHDGVSPYWLGVLALGAIAGVGLRPPRRRTSRPTPALLRTDLTDDPRNPRRRRR